MITQNDIDDLTKAGAVSEKAAASLRRKLSHELNNKTSRQVLFKNLRLLADQIDGAKGNIFEEIISEIMAGEYSVQISQEADILDQDLAIKLLELAPDTVAGFQKAAIEILKLTNQEITEILPIMEEQDKVRSQILWAMSDYLTNSAADIADVEQVAARFSNVNLGNKDQSIEAPWNSNRFVNVEQPIMPPMTASQQQYLNRASDLAYKNNETASEQAGFPPLTAEQQQYLNRPTSLAYKIDEEPHSQENTQLVRGVRTALAQSAVDYMKQYHPTKKSTSR